MASPIVLIGICVLVVGNILHIVGTATTHWFEVDYLRQDYGLFKVCAGTLCSDYRKIPKAIEATRALTIIGVPLGLCTLGLVIMHQLVKAVQNIKLVPFAWVASALGAFVFIIIGVIVFASDFYESNAGDLGFSFALCIVGALGIGGGGAISFIGSRMSPPS